MSSRLVFMEDLDVTDCCDDTFLPDFGCQIPNDMASTDTSCVKRKLDFSVVVKDEDGFDDRLRRAARKSQTEGNLTPLVKEELRCFIAAKRHQEGKQELKVEFNEPEQHPLTVDEIRKKERRREQNRRAATKCRKKKKDAKSVKENEMKILRDSNSHLQKEVKNLNLEVKHLTDVLQSHENSSQCRLSPTSTSFLDNIPTHHYGELFRDEPETSDPLYSPRSPSAFFSSTNVFGTCSGYIPQFTGNTRLSTEMTDHHPYASMTPDLTPPVSPYLTEFSDTILQPGSIIDPQLSDILHNVDYLSQNM